MKGYSLHNETAEYCGPIELTSAHATASDLDLSFKLVPTMGEAAFQPSKRTSNKSKKPLDDAKTNGDWEVLCHGSLGMGGS